MTSPTMSGRLFAANELASAAEPDVFISVTTSSAPASSEQGGQGNPQTAPDPGGETAAPSPDANPAPQPDRAETTDSPSVISRDSTGAYPMQQYSSAACACSTLMPFTTRDRPSKLSDGTPTNLAISEHPADPLSAAIWTMQVSEKATVEKLDGVLQMIAKNRGIITNHRVVGSGEDPQLEANLTYGDSVAKVNLRSTQTHLYVLFVGSSEGSFVEPVFGKLLQSFRPL